MKSIICYSLLFLSLLSCKTAPDAIVEFSLSASKGLARLDNFSTACLSNNYDVDWGDGHKEHLVSNSSLHQYYSTGVYAVKLTVYNVDNKPFSKAIPVTISSL